MALPLPTLATLSSTVIDSPALTVLLACLSRVSLGAWALVEAVEVLLSVLASAPPARSFALASALLMSEAPSSVSHGMT